VLNLLFCNALTARVGFVLHLCISGLELMVVVDGIWPSFLATPDFIILIVQVIGRHTGVQTIFNIAYFKCLPLVRTACWTNLRVALDRALGLLLLVLLY
jgi:hypothetical protein